MAAAPPPPPQATPQATPANEEATPTPHEDEECATPPTENVLAPESRADAAAPTRGKAVEMRRVGDAAWRCFKSQKDAAKAFGLGQGDVSRLAMDGLERIIRRARKLLLE